VVPLLLLLLLLLGVDAVLAKLSTAELYILE
jgi:hypothetical protein